jgi:hypothetical protein
MTSGATSAFQEFNNCLRNISETIVRVCGRLDALSVLDEKLVPHPGEDETRIGELVERLIDPKTERIDPQSITPRIFRSFVKRWRRACNNSMKNFEHVMAAKRIDGCPRLTRARRLVARCTPQARKAASAQKRARYQDPSVKQRENTRQNTYRHAHPEIVKAGRRLQQDINYHRPFIAIDFEGMNYPGNDIDHDNVCYPDHGLFLGGASGVHRDKDGVWCEKPIEWLGYDDKRMLRGEELLEWLVSLPDKFGDANFGMFGKSYDGTQILKALRDILSKERHFKKVYEICKREKHGTKRSAKGAVCPPLPPPAHISAPASRRRQSQCQGATRPQIGPPPPQQFRPWLQPS